MKVLVTGANGFLGLHATRAMLDAGHDIVAMVQPGTNRAALDDLDVEVREAELTMPDSLATAVAGCEAVVHLAALVAEWGSYKWFERINLEGTRTLAKVARDAGCRRFLFVSSLAVHGFVGYTDGDEDAPLVDGGNPYARSKIRCEEFLREMHGRQELETVIIRPGMVPYGEGDLRGFAPLAKTLSAGRMPVCGDPGHTTCTVYAPNLAHGLCLALEAPCAAGRTYVITDDEKVTWERYLTTIARHLEHQPPRFIHLPRVLALAAAHTAEFLWRPFGPAHRPPLTAYLVRLMGRDSHFSCERARIELGYQPLVSFDDGMLRTCDWWKNR